jgi:peptidoglycan hydrolase-like protein with peptidoglycan-binding domain
MDGGVEPVPVPPVPETPPTIRRGSKGEWVTVLQTKLVQRGYDIGSYGIDGDYGRGTEAAVKAFQKDNGLTADGICGPRTWAALEDTTVTLYSVMIPHLTKSRADQLCSEYAGAVMTEEGR